MQTGTCISIWYVRNKNAVGLSWEKWILIKLIDYHIYNIFQGTEGLLGSSLSQPVATLGQGCGD